MVYKTYTLLAVALINAAVNADSSQLPLPDARKADGSHNRKPDKDCCHFYSDLDHQNFAMEACLRDSYYHSFHN